MKHSKEPGIKYNIPRFANINNQLSGKKEKVFQNAKFDTGTTMAYFNSGTYSKVEKVKLLNLKDF